LARARLAKNFYHEGLPASGVGTDPATAGQGREEEKNFRHKKAQAAQESLRRLAGKVLLFSVSV
jgi:hypothetical protein